MATGRARAQKARVLKHALQSNDPANPRAGRASQMDSWRTMVNLCLKPREKWAAKGVINTQPDQRRRWRRGGYCQFTRPPDRSVPGVEQAPKSPAIVRSKKLRETSTLSEERREVDIGKKRRPRCNGADRAGATRRDSARKGADFPRLQRKIRKELIISGKCG